MNDKGSVVCTVFREQFAKLSDVLPSQIDTVANELFSAQLIPQDVVNYEPNASPQVCTKKVLLAFQGALRAGDQRSRIDRLTSLLHILLRTNDKALWDIACHMRAKLMESGIHIPQTSIEEQEPPAGSLSGQHVRLVEPKAYFLQPQQVPYNSLNHRRVSDAFGYFTTADQASDLREVATVQLVPPLWPMPYHQAHRALARGSVSGPVSEMVMETGQFREHYSEPTACIHSHCKAPYPDFRVKHSSRSAEDVNVPPSTEFLTAPLQPQSSYSSTMDNTPTPTPLAIPSQPHPLCARCTPADLRVTDLPCTSPDQDSCVRELAAMPELMTIGVQDLVKNKAEKDSHREEAKRHSRLEEHHRNNSTAVLSQEEEGTESHKCVVAAEMREVKDQERLAGLTQLARSLEDKVTALEHVMNEKLERVTSELEEMKEQHHQLLMRTTNCSCSMANDELKEKLERVASELEKMSKQHHPQQSTRTTTWCSHLVLVFCMLVIVFVVAYSRPVVYVINGRSDMNPS